MKEIVITAREEGLRLDRFLGRCLPQASAGFLYKMLRRRNITVNGKKAQGGDRLSEGDVVRIYFSDETLQIMQGRSASREPELPQDFGVLYEDEHVLIADKPAGMLSQKAAGSDVSLNEYLADYLLRTGQMTRADLELFHPAACNRLDRNTSGIVLCGKTTRGLQALSELIRRRGVRKEYCAFVMGRLQGSGVMEGWIRKDHAANHSAMTRGGDGARSALLEYTAGRGGSLPVSGGGTDGIEATQVRIHLVTGRSHQIRVQMAQSGHALLGDVRYGDAHMNRILKEAYSVRRPMLHAASMTFPETDGVLSGLSGKVIECPLPDDMRRIAQVLAGRGPRRDR